MTLAPMLKEDGRLIGDFTLANLGDGEWFIAGSGVAEQYHMRWFEKHLPADGSVAIEALGLSLSAWRSPGRTRASAGEGHARRRVERGVSVHGIRRIDIGMAPCLVGRVSYTGDLGYEIWMAPEYQRHVFETLMEAGEEFGIGLFGSRALNALGWRRTTAHGRANTGRSTGRSKPGSTASSPIPRTADFIGKAGALAERKARAASFGCAPSSSRPTMPT